MSKLKPYIEMKNKPINHISNVNDPEYDDSQIEIYHVFISDGQLKILFNVAWHDPEVIKGREFQVIRPETLYLDNINYTKTFDHIKTNKQYPATSYPYTGNLTSDPTIANELFGDILNKYGIVLNKITVHNMEFFESKDYTFTDNNILEELYDLINDYCKKVKYEN